MVFLNLARSFLFFFFAVGSGVAPFPKASAKVGGWFFISKFWGKFFLIGAGGGWGKGVVCRGLGGDFFFGGGRGRARCALGGLSYSSLGEGAVAPIELGED